MVLRKLFYSFVLVVLIGNFALAGKDYQINVQIEGVADTTALLAYHYGNQQYVHDTVNVDMQGNFSFSGDTLLDKGMYLIVLPGQKYFEILVDDNQNFNIRADNNNLVGSMKFENSPENEVFYRYMQFLREKNQDTAPLMEKVNDENTPEEEKQNIQQQLQEKDREVKAYQNEIIEENPDGLFSKILLAQQEPPLPDTPVKEDGTPDNQMMYQIFKENFWSNIDFSDDRLLRTPMYHAKLDQYFTRVVIQLPDSIIAEADRMMEKAEAHPEVYKYTLFYITNTFERSQIMGMDAVFVHMVENYYMAGKADWATDEQVEKLAQRAMVLKPILLGKKAPDISVFKPDRSKINLHSVDARFTLLYFWDTECGHCKKQTPKIKEYYDKMKDKGIEVFAVNTEGEADREKWIDYINENEFTGWINVNDAYNQSGFRDKYDIYATPLLFLLDEDKKILAKNINIEQAEQIIEQEMKNK
ncbi:MAG: thioredoxin-like domain-containing protein [Bacteroidota bacterium]